MTKPVGKVSNPLILQQVYRYGLEKPYCALSRTSDEFPVRPDASRNTDSEECARMVSHNNEI